MPPSVTPSVDVLTTTMSTAAVPTTATPAAARAGRTPAPAPAPTATTADVKASLDADHCYRALLARDARFDGRFFVGVATTGIYCRPICPARTPKRLNCRFFASPAAAEYAGFRPCLRCRPEQAPGNASVDAVDRLARAAATLIDGGLADRVGIRGVARHLDITERHLRRVFEHHFGVAPIDYAQTARLLLAKRLLTDTTLPVMQIALASGFGSLRRFNALLAERYGLTPSQLRSRHRQARGGALPVGTDDALQFRLHTRPPFDFAALLRFFAARAIAGVERVDAASYVRSLTIEGPDGAAHRGRIAIRAAAYGHGVDVKVDTRLMPVIGPLLARIKHAADLDCDPIAIATVLGPLAAAHPGMRLPGSFDGFETAVRAIIGQQVTVRAARTVLGRVAERFGAALDAADAGPQDTVHRLFPTAAVLAEATVADIAALGIVRQRAAAIIALARAVAAQQLHLMPGADPERTIAALQELPGIGAWTAQYIAMRALHWPDAFPPNDVALARALGEADGPGRAARVAAHAERWRPWRSYAVIHLWASLEQKQEKTR